MNTRIQNVKISLNSESVSLTYPRDFNLRVSQSDAIKINTLTKELEELYQRYLSLLNRMRISVEYDEYEHYHQSLLLQRLEEIVKHRHSLSCKIKQIQLTAIRQNIDIIESMLDVKEEIINHHQTKSKKVEKISKPSSRWSKIKKK